MNNIDKLLIQILSLTSEGRALRKCQIIGIAYYIQCAYKNELSLKITKKPSALNSEVIYLSMKKLINDSFIEKTYLPADVLKEPTYQLGIKGALYLNKNNNSQFDTIIMTYLPVFMFMNDNQILSEVVKSCGMSPYSIEFNQEIPLKKSFFD